jgi:hypothetical protein
MRAALALLLLGCPEVEAPPDLRCEGGRSPWDLVDPERPVCLFGARNGGMPEAAAAPLRGFVGDPEPARFWIGDEADDVVFSGQLLSSQPAVRVYPGPVDADLLREDRAVFLQISAPAEPLRPLVSPRYGGERLLLHRGTQLIDVALPRIDERLDWTLDNPGLTTVVRDVLDVVPTRSGDLVVQRPGEALDLELILGVPSSDQVLVRGTVARGGPPPVHGCGSRR